jgi:hypothetical protein
MADFDNDIDSIIAGAGLTGGGSGGDVTLAVATAGIISDMIASGAVTADKVAIGQLVKSFNGLTDNVVLAAGMNILLTPVGNTVTVSAFYQSLDPVLPLTLTATGTSGTTLHGEINITPVHDGGAVALQTGTPTFQIGFAAINEGLFKTGIFGNSGEITLATAGTIFNITTTFKKPITLSQASSDTGSIVGTGLTGPLFDTHAGSAIYPVTQWTGDVNNAFFFEALYDDGIAASLQGNVLYAHTGSFSRMAPNASLVTVGDYNIDNYLSCAFACDCSSGVVTFTLPFIDPPVTLSGETYTFIKTDNSTNSVLISGQGGQTINGQASYLLNSQWKLVKIMAIISSDITPLTFWVVISENNTVGPIGTSGYSGTSGKSGYSGYSGFSGYSSISGYSGFSGYSG